MWKDKKIKQEKKILQPSISLLHLFEKKIQKKLNIKETVSVYMNVCAFVSNCFLFHYRGVKR